MNFLVDTNFLSETRKPRPNPGVVKWLQSVAWTEMAVSVITLGELEQGIVRTPAQANAARLHNWLEFEIKPAFEGRIVGVDQTIMSVWAKTTGTLIVQGKSQPLFDSLLAATAIAFDLTLVTRNIKDVQEMPVKILNPWTKES
jgi:toxin FitB